MRDIRASVEVRAPIGEEGPHQLHGDAFARCHRWRCGRTGRATEPTSVIVAGHVIKLAHAACADSQIIKAPPGSGSGGELAHRNTTISKVGGQPGSFGEVRNHPAGCPA